VGTAVGFLILFENLAVALWGSELPTLPRRFGRAAWRGGAVAAFDEASYQRTATIPNMSDADNLRYDPALKRANVAPLIERPGFRLIEADLADAAAVEAGRVMIGEVELVPPQINEDFQTILEWADELRRLKVRANADTPEDAAKPREFGAQGNGPRRPEHMFMAQDRLPARIDVYPSWFFNDFRQVDTHATMMPTLGAGRAARRRGRARPAR